MNKLTIIDEFEKFDSNNTNDKISRTNSTHTA